MLRTSFNPSTLDSFLILRLVKREALSSTPTWSTLGDKRKSGTTIRSFTTLINLDFAAFKSRTIYGHSMSFKAPVGKILISKFQTEEDKKPSFFLCLLFYFYLLTL